MEPFILFRTGSHTDDEEFAAACRYFDVSRYRGAVPAGKLCIPRYSALPFYEELEADLALSGTKLINSYAQHQFVADIRQWVPRLRHTEQKFVPGASPLERGTWVPFLHELTPATWTEWHSLPDNMSFVVKGATNSRKAAWATRMYCPTKADVPRIAASLLDDALIADQGLVVREFVPLRTFAVGINGLPITNEWRFFCLNGRIIDAGYYWASEPDYEWLGVDASDDTPDHREGEAPAPAKAVFLVQQVLSLISNDIPFVVVDVAEKAEGGWICIELNDGSMSGLSMIPPDRFYKRLAEHVSAITS